LKIASPIEEQVKKSANQVNFEVWKRVEFQKVCFVALFVKKINPDLLVFVEREK